MENAQCQWQQFKRTSLSCQSILKQWFQEQMAEGVSMTENEILQAVVNDKFFGLVECDLHVPTHLQDYFSEMQPTFKHTSISRSDLEENMLNYAKTHKILRSPQKSLWGSYCGAQD